MRINIVGTTGSGKSVLAKQVASRVTRTLYRVGRPLLAAQLDPAPRELFRTRVAEALEGDAWAVAGNYSTARDLIWARADTVVWLDYPLPLVLWRLLRRTVRQSSPRGFWAGNHDSFRAQFLSRESLFCTLSRLTTVAAVSCQSSWQKHSTSISRSSASARRKRPTPGNAHRCVGTANRRGWTRIHADGEPFDPRLFAAIFPEGREHG